MRISCVQMNVNATSPGQNFARAEALVRKAARRGADVIVLPETWNTGFAPGKTDPTAADDDGARTKALFSALSKELGVNIVAGSVTNRKRGGVYNTAYVFDRAGSCIAEYDKTHLFSPAGEAETYRAGDALSRFTLDGVRCGVMICYDLRFPELARALALPGLDALFIPAEWPEARIFQMRTLLRARAVENQIFAALCNGCGEAFGVRCGGCSAIVGPLGETLAAVRGRETIVTADADIGRLQRLREELPVWKDRRPELYGVPGSERD
jgi:predicted amidohydrolase